MKTILKIVLGLIALNFILVNIRWPQQLAEGEKYTFRTLKPLDFNEIIPTIEASYAEFNLLYSLAAFAVGLLLLMLIGRANIFASLKKLMKQLPDFETSDKEE